MTRLWLPLCLLPALALAGPTFTEKAQKGVTLYATIETAQGPIVLELFSKDAPKTVANFVGLAAGEKAFEDPQTHAKVKRPFYDGLTFHRVIENFMIQGGDPEGTGRGGPGYQIPDEFTSGRRFDRVGLLAMANHGPDTGGSQFFITTSTPEHLNDHHTIFGAVVSGYEVVEAISRQRGPEKAVMIHVRISTAPPTPQKKGVSR